jgi:hypothetical protein
VCGRRAVPVSDTEEKSIDSYVARRCAASGKRGKCVSNVPAVRKFALGVFNNFASAF